LNKANELESYQKASFANGNGHANGSRPRAWIAR